MRCETDIRVSQSNEIPVSPQLIKYCAEIRQLGILMGRTTVGQRWPVIGMYQAGIRGVAVGRTLDMSTSTVPNILKRHRLNPDDVKDAHRSGRPQIPTPKEDRRLRRPAIRNRPASSMRLQRLCGIGASVVAVCRRLNQLRLRARQPAEKLNLTQRHWQVIKQNKTKINWIISKFKKVNNPKLRTHQCFH